MIFGLPNSKESNRFFCIDTLLTTVHCLARLPGCTTTFVGFPSRVSVLIFQSLPGLDFGVFKSLGPFVDRVQRVQMELHEHVRHEGEIPCSVLDDFD